MVSSPARGACFSLVFGLAALAPALEAAAPPRFLAIQGRLQDGSGAPMEGTTDVTVDLFDAESGGASVHTEVESVTFGEGGLFVSTLGDGVALDEEDLEQALWMELSVGGEVVAPRLQLTAAPYAVRAERAAQLGSPRRVLVPAAGSASENGTALLAALAAITDESAANPYWVELEPGTYDIDLGEVTLTPGIHLSGAGMDATTLTGRGEINRDDAKVLGAADSSLRDLTVASTGSNPHSTALTLGDGADTRVRDVRLLASGGSTGNTGIYVSGTGVTRDVEGVEIEASGTAASTGIWAQVADAEGFRKVVARLSSTAGDVNGAFGLGASTLGLTSCRFELEGHSGGDLFGVSSQGAATLRDVEVRSTGAGSNNSHGVFVSGSSTAFEAVGLRVDVTGSSTATGVEMDTGVGSVRGSHLRAHATAGDSYGVDLAGSGTGFVLEDSALEVDADSGAGDLGYGVHLSGVTYPVTLRRSSIDADSSGGSGFPVWEATGSATVGIENCILRSATGGNTVRVNAGAVSLGASKLEGDAVILGAGSVTCVACYDETFTSPGLTTCP